MQIRRYEPRDHEACRALWRELTEWHRELYDDQSIGGDGDLGDQFDEHLEHVGARHIWVAERDGAVVGFVGLIVEGRRGELEPLVVTRDARGSGVGRVLAECVIAAAREQGLRRLDVRPAARNVSAVQFFHDAGFETLGQYELMLYLDPPREWPFQERIAERDFRA